MNWFAAIRSKIRAYREAPRLLAETRRQLADTTESLHLMRYDRDELAFYSDPRNMRDLRERNHLNEEVESWMLAGSGPRMLTPGKESMPASVPVKVTERLWELELALEDRGWQRQLAFAQTEFSRYGLQQIILICRLGFIKNPLIRRGVLVSSYYTFGRGVEIMSTDEAANETIQAFLAANKKELGQIGLVEKDQSLHTDGQLFFVCFRNVSTGELKVRTIDAVEIADIVTDPDDASIPQYYLRRWIARVYNPDTGAFDNQQREKFYPALGLDSPKAKLGDIEVLVDQPMHHMKTGGEAKWLFGCPEIYSVIDWARAYKSFLEDWASLNRALARFAWNIETKGGQAAIQNFQNTFNTTLGIGGRSIETNPPPVTGSAFITGPGNKLEPVKTAGVTGNPEQGRRVLLMVCAAFGLPETFFGDASTGSLATAQSLDRPTELKFLERQERWRETLQTLVEYALRSSNTAPNGKLREARKGVNKNGDLSDIAVTIKFPAVLEHDIPQMISAIVQAATLGGFDLAGTADMKTVAVMLLSELGVEDPVAVFEAMYPDYDEKDWAKSNDEPDPNAPQAHPSIVKPSFGAESARMTEAIRQLQRAAERMAARA